MTSTGIVFPHQLFENSPLISACSTLYLVEEHLFFSQYNFHKQKIAFHRASLKFYETHLLSLGKEVIYINSQNPLSDVRELIPFLKKSGIQTILYIDPTDNWLEKRIRSSCHQHQLTATPFPSPLFLNLKIDIQDYFSGKKRMFQTDFYKAQRLNRNLLMESGQKPMGGQWTFDAENRLKYPKGKIPPKVKSLPKNPFYEEAAAYTKTN
ncbi:MAG TPA: cryptochrome/photolyase family protein, partial [Catalimonadaceae bacterium]|nr:cryptochrome/photolyase family protein [Catalimonadaceae bacterium]